MEERLRVFTAFSGYDSQCMALDRLGIGYELVGWSEIDKYAIMAHDAVYPQWKDRNFGDISKIDWSDMPDFDLFTYSFPCTDISSAGQQRGLEEGSGTRSSLLWECKKAIEAKKPKYLLMENVKALTQGKFMPYLKKWMSYLAGLGYSSYARVLNAKDFGVPQNRERLFVVSILGGGGYSFPKPFELKLRLKDVLEEDVDERYYLSDKLIDYVFSNGGVEKNIKGAVGVQNGNESALCVTANYYKTPRQGNYLLSPITCAMRGRNPDNPSDRTAGIPTEQRVEMGGDVANCITTVQKDSLVVEPVLVGGVGKQNFGKQWRQGNRIYDANSIAMCLMAQPLGNAGGYSYLYRVEDSRNPKIIQVANISEEKGFSNPQTGRIYSSEGLCPTLDTMQGGGKQPKIVEPINLCEDGICRTIKAQYYKNGTANFFRQDDLGATAVMDSFRIRKLTPKECFRLMDVEDSDIDKIMNAGISNTQCYKMAGNSIVVSCLYHIFRKLFVDKGCEELQLELFNQ